MFDFLRSSHNQSLGAERWSGEVRNAMVTEMRRTARDERGNQDFHGLALLGELGDDERLRLVLKEAFADVQEVQALRAPPDAGEMVAPLFAASRGAALASLLHDSEERQSAPEPARSWFRTGSAELR